MPDSLVEPDQLGVVQTDPLIIHLDDVSGDPVFVYNYEDVSWPEPKVINQPATRLNEFSTTNNVTPTGNTTARPFQLPVYDGNG